MESISAASCVDRSKKKSIEKREEEEEEEEDFFEIFLLILREKFEEGEGKSLESI